MIRVNVVAEGQSEMAFAKKLLNEYFGGSPIVDSRCVLTSKNQKTNYEYRGGLLKYHQAKNDIVRWLKEDANAYVTTMFDFYRLPADFPGYHKAMECLDCRESEVLKYDYLEREDMARIDHLYEETKMIPPEEINHGEETAPSKRLLRAVNYHKGELVSEWLAMIGMDEIRKKCPHFSEWITKLQTLSGL